MGLLANIAGGVPQDANGRALAFRRAVKGFDANTVAALEAAINTFLTTLETTPPNAVVIDIQMVAGSGSATRAIVSYGYFVPAP